MSWMSILGHVHKVKHNRTGLWSVDFKYWIQFRPCITWNFSSRQKWSNNHYDNKLPQWLPERTRAESLSVFYATTQVVMRSNGSWARINGLTILSSGSEGKQFLALHFSFQNFNTMRVKNAVALLCLTATKPLCAVRLSLRMCRSRHGCAISTVAPPHLSPLALFGIQSWLRSTSFHKKNNFHPSSGAYWYPE